MPRLALFKVILSMILLLTLSSHSTTLAQESPVEEDASAPEIRAVISPMISYQGRLVESGVPANGDRLMSFSIERTDEVEIWSMPAAAVSVSNGLFQVNLGPFAESVVSQMHQDLWLTVQVEGTDLPPQQLLGAPYAFSLVPGAVIRGTSTTVPMLSVSNESGLGISGHSVSSYGVYATSTNKEGLRGSSTNSTGVYGESTHGTGVFAYSYAVNTPALSARSDADLGIAISALVDSTNASIVTKNTGTGPLLKGYAGDDEFVPEFIIQNDGTVQQGLGASGLVKAGALVDCAKTDSAVIRQFNNVIGADPITVSDMDVTGSCHIDPGFDLSTSYWVVTNPDPTPHIISCAVETTEIFVCARFDLTGNVVDGNIMILIY